MSTDRSILLAQAVAGRVLLLLDAPPPSAPASVRVAVASGANAQAPVLARTAVRLAQGRTGTLAALDLDALAMLPLYEAPLEVALLDAEGRPVGSGEARLTPVGIDAGGIAAEDRSLIEQAIAGGLFPAPIAAALRWRLANSDFSAAGPYHLDHAVPIGGGVIVGGWAANIEAGRIVVLSDGLESARAMDDIASVERRDVSNALTGQGIPVRTHRHGFMTTLPLFRPGDQGFIVLEAQGTGMRCVARMSWDGPQRGDTEGAIAGLTRFFGGGDFLPPERARRHLAPLFGRTGFEAPAYDVVELKPASEPPLLSVIVPLYGQPFLIRGLLQNQSVFPDGTEFVFVSDDPELHPFARDYMGDRASLLARPSRLLLNRANYGFSIANNLGFREARAPIVLFQNSDVRVEDPQGLHDGIAAVRDGRFGIVGFRLLFEDGTVQHDGMRFERSRALHGLFTAEHPGKGLPPLPATTEPVAPVEAVTGAMMMMERDLYLKLGGFDPSYVRGDFEDGDLCLAAAAAGRPVGVARRGRIRHLERQSIAATGGGRARGAITYINCIRFNERWGADLGRAA